MIDSNKFISNYMSIFGVLVSSQFDAITALLTDISKDTNLTDIRWIAYSLATVKYETDDTYLPIEEIGKGRNYSYGNPDPITGQTYYGRGYVDEFRWKRKYQEFENHLKLPLVNSPDIALDPTIAYKILSLGMRQGLFTGKKLSDYIINNQCDYFNARKIINGLNHASAIEQFANQFELILKNS
jgi:putative chitinase